MKRHILFIYVIAFIMLAMGGSIYLLFRNEVIFTSWVSDFFAANITKYDHIINPESFIGGIFLYSLADALWYGSLLLFELPLRSDNWYSRMMTIAVVILPFLLELLQFLGIISGVFDWNDILIYLLTLITISLCVRKLYYNF